MRKFRERILGIFDSEIGTVESSLVLIPTILLFLSVLQIAASVLGRGVTVNALQGEVSREALLGSNNLSQSSDNLKVNFHRIALPGGGSIILGSREVSIPKLTPLILFQDKFLINGIAIDEN